MASSSRHPLLTRQPADIIVRAQPNAVRTDEFLGCACALAESLPDRRYVINLSSNRYEFLLGFCAAVIAGQCTLLPPNRQPQTLLQIAGECGPVYTLGGNPVAGLEFHAPEIRAGARPLQTAPAIADDQLCAIVFTSGSTGAPKPNRKTWGMLRAGSLSNAAVVLGELDRVLNVVATVPSQHMWGFETSILLPMFGAVAVSSPIPFFPMDIKDALDALPRPRALVSSPVHLQALLEAGVGAIEIDRIYSATAPTPAALARSLEAGFSARMIEIFGSSESGIFATRQPAREEVWTLAKPFALRASGRRTLIIADHLDEPVMLGDTVAMHGQRQFRWLGRDQDMINIAGKRGSLADINQRLNALPGVSDAIAFLPSSGAKRLAALVVAPMLEPSDILAGLRDSIDPAFLPRPIYRVPALPRQETGKLSKKSVLDLFWDIKAKRQAVRRDNDEQAAGD